MKKQLAKGVLWLSAAKLLVNILSLCSTFILARILTPEDFGLVAISATILEILTAMTTLSLASSLIHQKNPTEEHYHTAWTMNLIRATLVGGAFALAGPMVAKAYEDPRLGPIMFWMGLSVFLGGLGNPKMIVFSRQLIFKQEFAVVIMQKLASVAVSIAVALIYKTYWALIAGIVATQVAGIVTTYILVHYRPRFCLKHARELLSFSIWLSLGQMVNTLNWRLDHLLIGARLGPSTLGIYTVGDNLASLPTRETIGPIEQALFPGLKLLADDPDRLKDGYRRTQALITALALPVGVLFALQAETLVQMVLGEKWAQATIVVQYLAVVFALQTMASAVRPLALATGATRLLFLRDVMGFAMRVPLIVAAAYFGGLVLILQARTLTGLLGIALNMTIVRRLLGFGLLTQLRNNERSLLSISITAAVTYFFFLGQPFNGNILTGVTQLLLTTTLGLFTYSLLHLTIWKISGSPPGAESEVLNALKQLEARISIFRRS